HNALDVLPNNAAQDSWQGHVLERAVSAAHKALLRHQAVTEISQAWRSGTTTIRPQHQHSTRFHPQPAPRPAYLSISK
ncbi:unnamed protein product, partial [Closterium sp. Yama58-4]